MLLFLPSLSLSLNGKVMNLEKEIGEIREMVMKERGRGRDTMASIDIKRCETNDNG